MKASEDGLVHSTENTGKIMDGEFYDMGEEPEQRADKVIQDVLTALNTMFGELLKVNDMTDDARELTAANMMSVKQTVVTVAEINGVMSIVHIQPDPL